RREALRRHSPPPPRTGPRPPERRSGPAPGRARSALDEAPPEPLTVGGQRGGVVSALERLADRLQLDCRGAEDPEQPLLTGGRVQASPERERDLGARRNLGGAGRLREV